MEMIDFESKVIWICRAIRLSTSKIIWTGEDLIWIDNWTQSIDMVIGVWLLFGCALPPQANQQRRTSRQWKANGSDCTLTLWFLRSVSSDRPHKISRQNIIRKYPSILSIVAIFCSIGPTNAVKFHEQTKLAFPNGMAIDLLTVWFSSSK